MKKNKSAKNLVIHLNLPAPLLEEAASRYTTFEKAVSIFDSARAMEADTFKLSKEYLGLSSELGNRDAVRTAFKERIADLYLKSRK